MQGAQIQSLVGELRSHMLCGTAKKKKKSLEIKILWQFQDLLKEKYKILAREIKEVLKSWVLGSISSYEDTTQ